MIPLSTSRIYIFNIENDLPVNLLLKKIHDVIKAKFSELTYKNIEYKIVKNGFSFTNEIHINHLLYKKRRNFTMETSNMILMRLIELLSLISLNYSDINFVNDGFDRQPSLGLSRTK